MNIDHQGRSIDDDPTSLCGPLNITIVGGILEEEPFRSAAIKTHDVTRVDSDNPPTGDAISDKLNFYVRYNPRDRRFWLEYRLRANGDEPTQIGPGDPLPPVGERIPSFTIHTLSGGVRVYERGRQVHDLTLVADNLTDELYAEFSNATFFRPQPKRNFLATYRVRF